MFCTQCGAANEGTATVCSTCKATLSRPGTTAPPTQISTISNYLVPAILVTLCCCQIPGIVAIVYAAQVNGLVRAGDFAGARRASKLAAIWSWVGFGIGVAGGLVYAAIAILGRFAQ